MWPEKNTAILVIHGAGPHQLFEVGDKFVRGFHAELEDKNEGKKISIKHRLLKREEEGGWVQNYISLSLPDKKPTLDIYEYFWDIFMVHGTSLGDMVRLLNRASEGARLFYEQNRDLAEKALEAEVPYFRLRRLFGRGKVEFGPGAYLKILGRLGTFLSGLWLIPGLSRLVLFLANIQPLPIVNRAVRVVLGRVEELVRDLAGDVICYLDQDPRSDHHETRQKIINGAVQEIKQLINGKRYERIIVAGHSLGSVIAYDALNRVIQEANADGREAFQKDADKIRGLVTFGSPLDKIALCFWKDAPNQGIRLKQAREAREISLAQAKQSTGIEARYLTAMENDDWEVLPSKEQARNFLRKYAVFLGLDPDQFSIEVDNPYVRRHVLARYHRFRTHLREDDKVEDNSTFALEKANWLNFYHPTDLASGRLDLYDLSMKAGSTTEDGNICVEGTFSGTGEAHACYWEREYGMYALMAETFF